MVVLPLISLDHSVLIFLSNFIFPNQKAVSGGARDKSVVVDTALAMVAPYVKDMFRQHYHMKRGQYHANDFKNEKDESLLNSHSYCICLACYGGLTNNQLTMEHVGHGP